MKQLRKVLYITETEARLHLEGEALTIELPGKESMHIPLHLIEEIVSFSYIPVSPALLEFCAQKEIPFVSMNKLGHVKYIVRGITHGNVILRKKQYQMKDKQILCIAKKMIEGKIQNQIILVRQFKKNHPSLECEEILERLQESMQDIHKAASLESLRGIEGAAATVYFSLFGSMIISEDPAMHFEKCSKRPPQDHVNALMSFVYVLLAQECRNALECVGLDPYCGILHQIRPGKPALALDLMEELRPEADRFTLRLINLGIINSSHFEQSEEKAFLLTDEGRKRVLTEWNQNRQKEEWIAAAGEKGPHGVISLYQSSVLAKTIMKEEEYVPYRR